MVSSNYFYRYKLSPEAAEKKRQERLERLKAQEKKEKRDKAQPKNKAVFQRQAYNVHEPSQEIAEHVAKLAGYGVSDADIASLIGVSIPTLKKYYIDKLQIGKARANVEVGKALYQKAVDGDTQAGIWWSKTQMGWRDSSKLEITGENGGPVSIGLDVGQLSNAALLEIMALRDAKTIEHETDEE